MKQVKQMFGTKILGALALVLGAGCAATGSKGHEGGDAQVEANLANFDDLDFNVFTGRKWAEFHRSHSSDIIVHWPDGHSTKGLEKHIEDLEAMFVYAPDTRIREHPVKVGQGDWTAVIGYMEGTFSQPMPVGDGKTIPPTGKTFRIRMCTVGHWENGVMTEEYLFWDNQEFMKQIGLGK